MAKICFIPKNFGSMSLEVIESANAILTKYTRDGMILTLRQLYYQFVGHDLFPQERRFRYDERKKGWVKDANGTINATPNYKWLGEILADARNAGLIDWDFIEDRNRDAVLPSAWKSPADIVLSAARQFRVDRWQGQRNHVEVMVEKDALSNILSPVCNRYHVRFSANKGYSSVSMMFEAGMRVREWLEREGGDSEDQYHIIYFGDHDPSGIDMTRDIEDRIKLYTGWSSGLLDGVLVVHRVALNIDQVRQWNPPPNPAKETDSRFGKYRDEFGEESWELDAVEAGILRTLAENAITDLIDRSVWNSVMAKEEAMRQELMDFAENYGKPRGGKITRTGKKSSKKKGD